MLKNFVYKNLYKSSNGRQLFTNVPKYNNGGKVFNDREKAAEGVWARQVNEQELESLFDRLKKQQKTLEKTQKKITELRASLNSKK